MHICTHTNFYQNSPTSHQKLDFLSFPNLIQKSHLVTPANSATKFFAEFHVGRFLPGAQSATVGDCCKKLNCYCSIPKRRKLH